MESRPSDSLFNMRIDAPLRILHLPVEKFSVNVYNPEYKEEANRCNFQANMGRSSIINIYNL